MNSPNSASSNMTESRLALDRAHLLHSLHNRPASQHIHLWESGHGATLVDANGKTFLDAISGMWNVNVGHGREELAEAAANQMQRLAFASSYAGSSSGPAIELAETLSEICYPTINRFFFTCGGAEANEAAFKTARFYWKRLGQPDKTKFISRIWGYHGTTLATMSATGIATYWPMFEPRVPGFSHIESPYPYRFDRSRHAQADDPRTDGQIAADLLEEELLRQGSETVAAYIAEPIQGAGGVLVPQDDYWPRIRKICDRHNVLLIADEVITGFGRTGDWFALTRYGIEPDLVTFAKGITSGYFPTGGCGLSDRVASVIYETDPEQTWMHAHTYSAHPVGCAVALANLEILKNEHLLDRANTLGERLRSGLQTLSTHPNVGEVRGIGLMAAVELVSEKKSKTEFKPEEKMGQRIHQATQVRGMFTRMRGDVYNFAPCFVTSEQQIDQMVQILADSIEEVLGL